MSKSKIPTKIKSMVETGYRKNLTSKQITDRINKSATAKKLNVELSRAQVAALMAWCTMRKVS